MQQKLGIQDIVKNSKFLNVNNLVFSCRVPWVHPYLYLKLREIFYSSNNRPTTKQLNDRKHVLYFSRNHSDSRNVLNEYELLKEIKNLLHKRNLNEILIENFNSEKFENNTIFAAPETLILEFQPSNNTGREAFFMMWERSHIYGEVYIFIY